MAQQKKVKFSDKDLQNLSPNSLRAILKASAQLNKRLEQAGPQDDDALHEWIKKNIGIDIPRTSVCEDHDPPFNFIADLYFERTNSAMLLANRGGGKTFMTALLHYINAIYKPGYWGLSFGATEAQSDICYSHLQNWIYEKKPGQDGIIETVLKPFLVRSVAKLTELKNGSRITVVTGSKKSVNGPHPNLAHADEVDQMEDEPWDESRNMAMASRTQDGKVIPAQDVFTSTRKSANGRMQMLVDKHDDALKDGQRPPFKLYKHCTFESTAEVPQCRMAPDEERRVRLAQLGKSTACMCDCDEIRSGKMEDGSPRTLDKVCRGRYFKSRGWRPLQEVQNTFTQTSKAVWEAQQECRKPLTEGNYLPWDERQHGIRGFLPDPDNGPIYQSADWGGTNPNAVGWVQRLDYDTQVESFEREIVTLPAGSFVLFDEIYRAETGATELADIVINRENFWRTRFPDFRVKARFPDPAGKQQIIDWRNKGLKMEWHGTRDKDYMIQKWKDLFSNDHFYADVERCPNFVREVVSWRADPKTGREVEFMNHMMASIRYLVHNVTIIEHYEAKRGIRSAHKHNQSPKVNRKLGIKRGPLGLGKTVRESINI